MITAHIERLAIGYRYWTMLRGPYGWRQVGIEAQGVMDDFGDLVLVGGVS